MDLKNAFSTNRDTWDKKVAVHEASEFYDIENFKKGKSSLTPFETHALGDVKGKKILHLQCHFGQDTMSFQRMGAKCTGVDISTEAVKLARNINKELQLDTTFLCCNVLDTSSLTSETFDIVFTSYGTIVWLPDLKPWAKMIQERLKPGGVFYIVDFHPIAWMYDYNVSPPKLKYGYQQKEAIYEEYKGTYADEKSKIESKEYSWNHGLGEVVTSLCEAGLSITYLKEHKTSPYDIFPGLIKNKEGLFELNEGLYPLIFELKASNPSKDR
jgi:SAM-dependent methyltransferase